MNGKYENKLITRDEAAKYLGVTTNTLAMWACHRENFLPMIKIGRKVMYLISDLDDFIEKNRVGWVVKRNKKHFNSTPT